MDYSISTSDWWGFIILFVISHIAFIFSTYILKESKQKNNLHGIIISWFVILVYPCLFWACMICRWITWKVFP
jgi:hypothetical protein